MALDDLRAVEAALALQMALAVCWAHSLLEATKADRDLVWAIQRAVAALETISRPWGTLRAMGTAVLAMAMLVAALVLEAQLE